MGWRFDASGGGEECSNLGGEDEEATCGDGDGCCCGGDEFYRIIISHILSFGDQSFRIQEILRVYNTEKLGKVAKIVCTAQIIHNPRKILRYELHELRLRRCIQGRRSSR